MKKDFWTWLDENNVRIEEVMKGGRSSRYPYTEDYEWQNAITEAEENSNWDEVQNLNEAWEEFHYGSKVTKFSQWQIPGGENYRELLLTLPEKKLSDEDAGRRHYDTFIRKGGEPSWQELSDIDKEKIINSMPAAAQRDNVSFRSPHFDETNILAHVRFNERTDSDGNRVLFVEEIQSD